MTQEIIKRLEAACGMRDRELLSQRMDIARLSGDIARLQDEAKERIKTISEKNARLNRLRSDVLSAAGSDIDSTSTDGHIVAIVRALHHHRLCLMQARDQWRACKQGLAQALGLPAAAEYPEILENARLAKANDADVVEVNGPKIRAPEIKAVRGQVVRMEGRYWVVSAWEIDDAPVGGRARLELQQVEPEQIGRRPADNPSAARCIEGIADMLLMAMGIDTGPTGSPMSPDGVFDLTRNFVAAHQRMRRDLEREIDALREAQEGEGDTLERLRKTVVVLEQILPSVERLHAMYPQGTAYGTGIGGLVEDMKTLVEEFRERVRPGDDAPDPGGDEDLIDEGPEEPDDTRNLDAFIDSLEERVRELEPHSRYYMTPDLRAVVESLHVTRRRVAQLWSHVGLGAAEGGES